MAVSIDSSGQICFSVTEISLKPTRHYDLQDYVGSQTLVQLQVSSNPRLHLHLLNSLHQNGTEALHKISSQLFFIPEAAKAVWFSGGNREVCSKYRRKLNVELNLSINKNVGR